jgi:cell fate (sporulation/competence/biofilm development) regulator YlbF (YheA/YmcA/DUF963 family)
VPSSSSSTGSALSRSSNSKNALDSDAPFLLRKVALKRAASEVDDDRELVELRRRLEGLESQMVTALKGGNEPDESQREEYEKLAQDLQVRPAYQKLAAAQANFDKVLQKVNETISKGIQEGSTSRIIYPS